MRKWAYLVSVNDLDLILTNAVLGQLSIRKTECLVSFSLFCYLSVKTFRQPSTSC